MVAAARRRHQQQARGGRRGGLALLLVGLLLVAAAALVAGDEPPKGGGTALFRSDTAFENNPDHEPEEKPVHKTKKNKGVALQGLGGGEGELELVGGAGFEGEEEEEGYAGGFWGAFVNSLSMIIVTELGDKTFFIAAVLAMRDDRLMIFGGAIGALILMTVLSAAIGNVLPNLLPRKYTHYASAMLFLYFGIKLLLEARGMEGDGPSDELEEVEAELIHKKEGVGHSPTGGMSTEMARMENGGASSSGKLMDGGKNPSAVIPSSSPRNSTSAGGHAAYHPHHKHHHHHHDGSRVLTQAFTLTFLAEWGDRSQIATIALAAAKDPYGVTAGGILGHSLCTGLAVVGGRILAARISERTVAMTGGVLFLIFCGHSLLVGP